jgi:hypothetical protein
MGKGRTYLTRLVGHLCLARFLCVLQTRSGTQLSYFRLGYCPASRLRPPERWGCGYQVDLLSAAGARSMCCSRRDGQHRLPGKTIPLPTRGVDIVPHPACDLRGGNAQVSELCGDSMHEDWPRQLDLRKQYFKPDISSACTPFEPKLLRLRLTRIGLTGLSGPKQFSCNLNAGASNGMTHKPGM